MYDIDECAYENLNAEQGSVRWMLWGYWTCNSNKTEEWSLSMDIPLI